MSKPMSREQLLQFLHYTTLKGSEAGDIMAHDAALRAENERLKQQWSEAALQRVQTIEELRAENERLRNDLSDALDMKAGHGPTVLTDLRAQVTALTTEKNEALGALGYPVPGDTPCPPRYKCGLCEAKDQQVTALERERDGWKKQYQACHVLHLAAQAECEEKNTFMLNVRAVQAEQQLAAMMQERDGYIKRIEEEEPIFHSLTQSLAAMTKERDTLRDGWNYREENLQQQLADSQTANVALRDEIEQLHADYRSEQRMSEDIEQQLATMTAENADLRAMGERLLARLSEGKVMIDDIKITPEETP